MTKAGIVLLIIGGVIILFFGVCLVFLAVFKNHMTRHNRALSVYLNAKFDKIKDIYALLKSNDILYKPEIDAILANFKPEDVQDQQSKKSFETRSLLSYLTSDLLSILANNKICLENQTFVQERDALIELDHLCYNTIAIYNADVIGYNYWISFLPTRWIFDLLNIHKKDIIR